jgi:GDP-D-mannose 3',5'-epimerase
MVCVPSMSIKRVCVTGAGGFIGGHLAKRLKADGCYVVGVDWKEQEYIPKDELCDEFYLLDLRSWASCRAAVHGCKEVYHLAADMGGMGFIHSNNAVIMFNNTSMSCNMLEAARLEGAERFFYASSACVYPQFLQSDSQLNNGLKEADAWPAQPQDAYGLEKLYTEEMCRYYQQDYGLETRVARFHNVYGPFGTWKGGREKAPAAFCRKVAVADQCVEVWGDGEQTRSFLYVDDCVEGIIRLMRSDVRTPVNLGSDEMLSVNEFVRMIQRIAKKESLRLHHLDGPQGVRGRNSNNDFVHRVLEWQPTRSLEDGLRTTYQWIQQQVASEAERGVDVSVYASSTVL